MKKKIKVVFIVWRGYNDFDHMLPVIHSLSTSTSRENSYEIDVVFDYHSIFFPKNDPRIKYLKSLENVQVIDVFNNKYNFIINNIINYKEAKLYSVVYKILRKLIYNYLLYKCKDINSINWNKVLGKSFKDYDNVLIFSAHQAKRIIDIVKLLKALNNSIKYILLPHGVTLCSNDMLSNNNMSKNNNIVDFSDRWKDMDYIFLSDNTLKNKAILSGVPLENLKLVGSARFCQEWLDIKKDIQIDGSIVVNKKNKKNILFLMPNMISNIFYDEVVRTIEFISQYDDISFIVQYRANEINLPKHIKNIHNITWITSEYTTSALIDWCDIAIHAVTTMQFECFQKKKIVVYPRYLMANTAICELYSAGVILKNRDDLRNTMNEISSDFNSFKGKYFSNEKNINKFIGDYVNAGGEMPALNNYINTIENIIKERE